jgi:hypothetical protein
VTDRLLTERELNRALLARQLLLERADLPVPRAIERTGGLQTQYAPSGYVGLWSRLVGFERPALTRALERRSVVQATVLRSTIHMVSARDYAPMVEAIREERRTWWLRATRHASDARAMAAASRRVRSFLAEGPRKAAEIQAELALSNADFGGVGLWVDLVRVPPSGTWERRRADLYGLAEDWIELPAVTAEEGVDLLIRRYLGAFGPASRKDIATWAGLGVTAMSSGFERVALRRFRDEGGRELVDLPRAPLPDPGTPAPIRFLPTWDAALLVHARRTQIVPERYRPRIFNTETPHSVDTFLIDGQVAGTWRFHRGHVTVDPFEKLPRATRRELDDEAERLAAFMA